MPEIKIDPQAPAKWHELEFALRRIASLERQVKRLQEVVGNLAAGNISAAVEAIHRSYLEEELARD